MILKKHGLLLISAVTIIASVFFLANMATGSLNTLKQTKTFYSEQFKEEVRDVIENSYSFDVPYQIDSGLNVQWSTIVYAFVYVNVIFERQFSFDAEQANLIDMEITNYLDTRYDVQPKNVNVTFTYQNKTKYSNGAEVVTQEFLLTSQEATKRAFKKNFTGSTL